MSMHSHLMQRLNSIADTFLFLLLWLQNNPVILSLLAGMTLPFIFQLPREERINAPLWLKIVACVSIFFFIFGSLSPITIKGLSFFFPSLNKNSLFSIPLWILTLTFTTVSLIFHITARRIFPEKLTDLNIE